MDGYAWQDKVQSLWKDSGYRGTVVAVPGAGKTRAALEALEGVEGKKLILVPNIPLKKQWEEQTDIEVLNIQSPNIPEADVLVIDESHRFITEKRLKKVAQVNAKKILALTATPNEECLSHFGKVILDVNFDEAKVAKFRVFFHAIPMTIPEHSEYEVVSRQIKGLMLKDPIELSRTNKQKILDNLIMKRRLLVYRMRNRIPSCLLILKNLLANKRKILVTARTIDEGKHLYDMLKGIDKDVFIYNSKMADESQIEDFKKANSSILISCQGLSEGFNVPDIDAMVMMSISITKASHIQGLGRAIRFLPDKRNVEIHVLVGRNTTDEKILAFADEYDSWIDPTLTRPTENDSLKTMYYKGRRLSMDASGLVFEKSKDGHRKYFSEEPNLTWIIRQHKPTGGKFTLYNGKVIIKEGSKFKVLGEWNGELRSFIGGI